MENYCKHKIFGAFVAAVLLLLPTAMSAQLLSVNTDVAWDAYMSPNLGFELTVADKSTLQINALTVQKPYGLDFRGTAIQPEYRYYFSGRPMHKHFVGIGAIGAVYKADIKGKEYDGYGVGAGMTFGYVLPITSRLNVDFHAGLGYVHYNQKEYFYNQDHQTNEAGYEVANAKGSYLMPTRIGVSLSYILR